MASDLAVTSLSWFLMLWIDLSELFIWSSFLPRCQIIQLAISGNIPQATITVIEYGGNSLLLKYCVIVNAQDSPTTGKIPHTLKKNANSPIIIQSAKNGDVIPSVLAINIAAVMMNVIYDVVETKAMACGLSLKKDIVQSSNVSAAVAADGRLIMNGELIWLLPTMLPHTKVQKIKSATKKRDPQKRRCHDGF